VHGWRRQGRSGAAVVVSWQFARRGSLSPGHQIIGRQTTVLFCVNNHRSCMTTALELAIGSETATPETASITQGHSSCLIKEILAPT
jgi:hypothetical protein